MHGDQVFLLELLHGKELLFVCHMLEIVLGIFLQLTIYNSLFCPSTAMSRHVHYREHSELYLQVIQVLEKGLLLLLSLLDLVER